jgi:hypothetical protein
VKTEDEASAIRADFEIRRQEGTARGRGFPAPVRARVLAYMAECRERGESVQTVAARLGMPSSTLTMWTQSSKRRNRTASSAPTGASEPFAPVTVRGASRVVLTSPSGWRAEIEFDDFARLVAARR